MSAKLIKSGEPFSFSAFSPGNVTGKTGSLRPAADSARGHAPTVVFSQTVMASAVVSNEQAATAERITTDATADAGLIVRTARAEAERLVAEATARATEIELAAHERGWAESQARAQEKLNLAVEDLRLQLAQSLEEVAGLRAELAAHVERDLVRLALEIAKKVVHREVKVDHEVALTLARVALGRLHSRAVATVRLHPNDYAYVCAHRERLGTDAAVDIVEDRSVGPGGCIIEGDLGEIDARIEQQFAEIEQNFLSV